MQSLGLDQKKKKKSGLHSTKGPGSYSACREGGGGGGDVMDPTNARPKTNGQQLREGAGLGYYSGKGDLEGRSKEKE